MPTVRTVVAMLATALVAVPLTAACSPEEKGVTVEVSVRATACLDEVPRRRDGCLTFPIVGATVEVVQTGATFSKVTDEDGLARFVIPSTPDGRFTVEVSESPFLSTTLFSESYAVEGIAQISFHEPEMFRMSRTQPEE